MRVACFIPIKANSERVPGKNFRVLNGRKLYEYVIENAINAKVFDDIFIDTNSDEIKEYALERNLKVIEREEWLASNIANGNDLLVHHLKVEPNYDYYFQLFATSPFMSVKTIRTCVDILVNSSEHDSIFTARELKGFYWMNGNPISYQPALLPRSQDLSPVIEETTALYGITKQALHRYHCRIGAKPYIFPVNHIEAVDINNEEDLLWAEWIASQNL